MSIQREEQATEPDDDLHFLDQVLNKLYDFGDGARKRKSKRKSATGNPPGNDLKDNTDDRHNTHTDLRTTRTSESQQKHTTSKTQQSTVEVVTFVDPRKKRKLPNPGQAELKVPEVKENDQTELENKLAIEKARLEVHQFGLSGYQKGQQRVFEQERAIMLGARPPKKQYVNYKVYQQMLKEKKLKEKEEAKSDLQKKKGKGDKRRTEKSKESSSGQLGGQVGRFKNGMLVLSSRDIKKVNVKRRK